MRRPARYTQAFARLALFCVLFGLTQPHASPEPPFTAEETARILALGPWPPVMSRDPSNRVSGHAEAITLGRRLFFDARMSSVGYIACVTCHQTDRAWTDNKARAHGMADVPRNTPTLANLRLQRWFGWAGGADSLWMQSILPILDPREIDSSPALVKRVFRRDPELACLYERVFHAQPDGADEVVLANVGKALAAFQETLVTGRTPFDAFRDALARNEAHANPYPAAAQRGLKLFVGRAGCVTCHTGPNFSSGAFHNTGVPPFVGQDDPDAGRHDAIRSARASPFNADSRHNDQRGNDARKITVHAPDAEVPLRHWGEFRTPSLRNVAVTAPYMHNGRFETLHDVLRHYSDLDSEQLPADRAHLLRPLRLTGDEIADLIAFLHTLTDAQGERRVLPPREKTPCDE